MSVMSLMNDMSIYLEWKNVNETLNRGHPKIVKWDIISQAEGVYCSNINTATTTILFHLLLVCEQIFFTCMHFGFVSNEGK